MSGLRLADFDIPERLCFSAGWAPLTPGESERARVGRWADWPAYLRDWAAVRDEYVSRHGVRRPNGEPFYADLAAAYAARYGLAALAASNDYTLRGLPEPREGETAEAYQRRMDRQD